MEFELKGIFSTINNQINPKRKMSVDMQRKLIRASIAFDKIEQCIRNIDQDLEILVNKSVDRINKKEKLRFIKKNISNQYYHKKVNTCRNYIELFKREFDDTLIDERIIKSFGSNKIKLVFLPDIKGLVKKLEHSLHVKELELIKNGKIIPEIDLDNID